MAASMGGRAAEELILGDFTTGAGSDIQQITEWRARWSRATA